MFAQDPQKSVTRNLLILYCIHGDVEYGWIVVEESIGLLVRVVKSKLEGSFQNWFHYRSY